MRLFLLLVRRAGIKRPVFRATTAELKKDREWLRNLERKSAAELREEIARSREAGGARLIRVREEADFRGKFAARSGGTGAVDGVGASSGRAACRNGRRLGRERSTSIPKGTAKPKSNLLEAGFLLGVTRIIAANLVKPVVVSFLEKQFGSYRFTRPLRQEEANLSLRAAVCPRIIIRAVTL